MSSVVMIFVGITLFVVAYLTYGAYVARRLGVDPQRPTPAETMRDEIDYVPTCAPIVLGHHFASIAGAGPILGPIIASAFGWLPVYLWIIVGGIFIGAVHDISAMIASIRHEGKSIGEVIEQHIGKNGKILFLIFAWSTLILVLAVFTRIVATTFESVPSAATASTLFILLALIFGFAVYRRKLPLIPTTLIGILLLFICVWLGQCWPIAVSATAWRYILLGYVFIAAVAPVWILLQPRDYLNSFLLYALIIGGVIGIFFARPSLQLPHLTQFRTEVGYLFPVLFVTVACGAISGFHSLVASGTTAKQVAREPDAKIIGYGGMLIESLLAIVALLAAATLFSTRFRELYAANSFVAIFSEGVGNFIAAIPLLGIEEESAITFSALAVSAFCLTSLDTCARLARFIFQELFARKGANPSTPIVTNRYFCTFITVSAGWIFLFSGGSDAIWPVFGSANQLLAALALLAVTVWLAKSKRRNGFVRYPMIFMFAVTLAALANLMHSNFNRGHYLLAVVGLLLFVLAILLGVQAIRSLRAAPKAGDSTGG